VKSIETVNKLILLLVLKTNFKPSTIFEKKMCFGIVRNCGLTIVIFAFMLFTIETDCRPYKSSSTKFFHQMFHVMKFWEDSPDSHYSIVTGHSLPDCPSQRNRDKCPANLPENRIGKSSEGRSLSPYEYCVNFNATRLVKKSLSQSIL